MLKLTVVGVGVYGGFVWRRNQAVRYVDPNLFRAANVRPSTKNQAERKPFLNSFVSLPVNGTTLEIPSGPFPLDDRDKVLEVQQRKVGKDGSGRRASEPAYLCAGRI